MASTYTANSGIQLIATGEQSGTWGDTTNVNFQIVDRLTNGVGSVTLSGTTHTLTTSDGSLSEGQYKLLVLGGSPSGTNTITIDPNDQQKIYFVRNDSGESAIFTQGSGTNVTVVDGYTAIIYADGGGAGANVSDLTPSLQVLVNNANWSGQDLSVTNGGTGASTAAAARTNLGLEIGADVQAYSAALSAFVGVTPTDTHGLVGDGSSFISTASSTSALLIPSGTEAQRPGTPGDGMMRYNEDTDLVEVYSSGAWGAIAGDVDLSSYTGDVGITGEIKATSYNESFIVLSGTTPFVNCETGNVFSQTLSGNTTFTFSNPPASGTAYGFSLKIVQDASASGFTVTWPSAVDWPGGTAPTLTDAANAVDQFVFYTHDAGTTWYGFTAGQDME